MTSRRSVALHAILLVAVITGCRPLSEPAADATLFGREACSVVVLSRRGHPAGGFALGHGSLNRGAG